MAEKWILASPEKWWTHGPENGKNGPKFICNNRLCAVSAKGDRTSKTVEMVHNRSLCSLPFALVPLWSLSQKGIGQHPHAIDILAQGRKAASLDTPPSRACGVSIHIEKSKLGVPTHIPNLS